ncbi:DarT1-associated NADAR antitoxin family protein [Xanthobacter flavus]|uniref:DarT1-associated NADAR antitoxin family protein n=1 Tax=Xanthobacter flavus TaxID=281 RepID=UPI0037290939
MASRPVFIPNHQGLALVEERFFDFEWSAGFSESQKKKNVYALHAAAMRNGLYKILEISSKSDDKIGRRLSAFSLKIEIQGNEYPLESVYQGSKVFELCGASEEVFRLSPLDAKRHIRALDCGQLIGFELEGRKFPLVPKNAFYDWLYIRSLAKHADWINQNVDYDGYTDIEFNPARQVNCQARAFAEYKTLSEKGQLQVAVRDFEFFSAMLPPI